MAKQLESTVRQRKILQQLLKHILCENRLSVYQNKSDKTGDGVGYLPEKSRKVFLEFIVIPECHFNLDKCTISHLWNNVPFVE